MTGQRQLTDRDYLEDGLSELACDDCGTVVRVRKHSGAQTSIQWSLRAVEECNEFAVRRALGEHTAQVATCGRLRESIERALADGRLSVLVPVGTPVEPAPRGRPPHGGASNDEAALEQEALEMATASLRAPNGKS